MKKSDRKSILENLDKALTPPAARRKPALATGLADYDDGEPTAAAAVAPTSGGQPTTPTPLRATPAAPSSLIAPARDFNKRANSIERDAMPSGMFPGTSKKLYDALYLRTRGAVKPTRTLRATKKDLSVWAGIKNRKTIDAHLRYFDMIGLVSRQWMPGQNEGYKFEVLLPEEIGQGVRPLEGSDPLRGSDQKLVRGSDQKMGSGGQTQTVDNTATYDMPQTFKTVGEKDDDEFARRLRVLERELTGKSSPTAKWAPLFELLADELKIAAARTGSVSDAPAFLVEHLRRRLAKPDAPTRRGGGKRAVATEPQPLAPEEIASPSPEELEEFERARAELEGK
jgi:hypothetical protein